MKRTLAISMMALTLMFGAITSDASAKTVASPTVGASTASSVAAAPQRWNRRSRTRFITRTVWQGRHLYRVTYRITTLWNGRTYSQMVSRIRIR